MCYATKLDRNLVVLAPTGVAALNVGGQTIHSFFQLPPGPQPIGKKLKGGIAGCHREDGHFDH
ncbi:MAG: hypothetical protein CM1200mP41_05850 [Gammaproteobacteria bacterium]|nr:MAG: hypothetical protein CM1200mP41_05850 [Gammaproteobacteria bacterium]